MSESALGVTAASLLLVAAGFQVLLAAGAPWAAAAYGGRAAQPDGRLTARYRVASAGTAVFLVCLSWLVLAAADVVRSAVPAARIGSALWVLVALFALNTLGNLAGRHPAERWGAGSVTAALTALLALLATR